MLKQFENTDVVAELVERQNDDREKRLLSRRKANGTLRARLENREFATFHIERFAIRQRHGQRSSEEPTPHLRQRASKRLTDLSALVLRAGNSSIFLAPAPNVMQERVRLRIRYVWVRLEISDAIKVGTWRASFLSAIHQIMEDGVF